MGYFVYIIYSESAATFYKGQTSSISDRLYRHNSGKEKATARYAPWKLVWSTQVNSRSDAVILERKLKNLSRTRLIEFINNHK